MPLQIIAPPLWLCLIFVSCVLAWTASVASAETVYADMERTLGTPSAIPVRGQFLRERSRPDLPRTTPTSQMRIKPIEDALLSFELLDLRMRPVMTLGSLHTKAEGVVHHTFVLPKPLEAGLYLLRVSHQGDWVGYARIQVLAEDFQGVVVRSDVDQTYLGTEFISKLDKLKLLWQPATERRPLPGMEQVYHALSQPFDDAPRPLVFLTGSPTFFKRTLEARMAIDEIPYDGLIMKPFGEIMGDQVRYFTPGKIPAALKAQVGYKLSALLRQRVEMPVNTREILMGDDSEADFLVYALYHRWTSNQMDMPELMETLRKLKVGLPWRVQVHIWAPRVRALLAERSVKGDPVQAIYINRTGKKASTHKIEDWIVPGLTCHHSGAWPLMLDLVEKGWVERGALGPLRVRLESLGQGEARRLRDARDAVRDGCFEEGVAKP